MKIITLAHSRQLDWCSRVRFRTPHKPVVSKTSEADIWLSSYDHQTDVGGQRGGCPQLSQRRGSCCFLLNKKEALSGLIQVNDEERYTSRESLWLPAIGTWRYRIRAYKWLWAMSVMFPVCKAPGPGPYSSIAEEFLHFTILRPKKPLGSWNLVNPLLRMNKASMDESAARLQPLVDQLKPLQHQTFAIEKFRDLIVTYRSCPGDKKIY